MKYAHRIMMSSLEDRMLLSVFNSDDALAVATGGDSAIVMPMTAARSSAPDRLPPAVSATQQPATGGGPPPVVSTEPAIANARLSNLDVVYVSVNDAVVSYGFGFSEHHVGDQQ